MCQLLLFHRPQSFRIQKEMNCDIPACNHCNKIPVEKADVPKAPQAPVDTNIYVEIGTNVTLQYDFPNQKISKEFNAEKVGGNLLLVEPSKVCLKPGTWFKFGQDLASIVGFKIEPDVDNIPKSPKKPRTDSQVKITIPAGTLVDVGIGQQTLEKDLLVKLPPKHVVLLPAGTVFLIPLIHGSHLVEFKKSSEVTLYA